MYLQKHPFVIGRQRQQCQPKMASVQTYRSKEIVRFFINIDVRKYVCFLKHLTDFRDGHFIYKDNQ
jgi:hypothetical protein